MEPESGTKTGMAILGKGIHHGLSQQTGRHSGKATDFPLGTPVSCLLRTCHFCPHGLDMATSTLQVVCECGKRFTVVDGPLTKSSIRCHLCGRMVDVPSRKKAIAKAQAEAEKIAAQRARERKVERAQESNYAGLHFDGVYRTSSPIRLDTDGSDLFGESLSLSLRFRRDLFAEYECRCNEKSEFEDEASGIADYKLSGGRTIRSWFGAGWWDADWEGTIYNNQLRMTYQMEVVGGGPAATRKCVVEGETTLLFVADQ